MIRATKSNAFTVSCTLVNADNSMQTGATVTYSLRNSADVEQSSGSFIESGLGIYYVNLTLATNGDYRIYIASAGYPSVTEDIEVSEDSTNITACKTDLDNPDQYKADVSALALQATLNTVASNLVIVKQIESGRWKIVNNQMIFYDSDGVTPILTFDLKDSDGNPIEAFPKERVPV